MQQAKQLQGAGRKGKAGRHVLPILLFITLTLTACPYPYTNLPPVPARTSALQMEAEPQESVLPDLESAEDVFKALGVWEDASRLFAEGLTPQQVAQELGIGPDRMHRRLVERGEEAYSRYNHQADKWVEEFFPPTDEQPAVVQSTGFGDILPRLENEKDVFRVLDVWEKAARLLENGLTLRQTARELDFGPNRMHERLMSIARERIREAIESNSLEPHDGEEMLHNYERNVVRLVETIFEENEEPVVIYPTVADDILPELESAEDVFRALGVWEKAAHYLKEGLSLEHTAREFGYGPDRMHEHLVSIASEQVSKAIESQELDPHEADEMLDNYSHLASEWVEVIFADVERQEPEHVKVEQEPEAVEIDDILPRLDSAKDVFLVLDMWEDAADLLEKGLTLEHTARELGYGPDRMHNHLMDIAEAIVREALDSDEINEHQARELLDDYERLVSRWVEEIFGNEEEPQFNIHPVQSVSSEDILPRLKTAEDVFRTLELWEDAVRLLEEGLTLGHTARELDYGPDRMRNHLMGIAEALVEEALESGVISERLADEMLEDYEHQVSEWIEEIFDEE